MVDLSPRQIKRGRAESITYITDDIINSIAKIKLFESGTEQDTELNNIAYEMHKKLLKIAKNKNKSKEVGLVWKISDICIRGISIGTENNTMLMQNKNTYTMIKDYKNIRDLVVMHNHPRNTPFSQNDIRCFCAYDTIQIMTAVCNDGRIHMLRKEANFSANATLLIFEENAKNKRLDFSGINAIVKNARKLGLTYRCSIKRR